MISMDSLEQKQSVIFPVFITDLQRHDVLLGRGAFCINYVGNVMFREICISRREEYNSTARRKFKNLIAQEIVEVVHKNGGRFLRQLNDEDEARKLGVPRGARAWVLADDASISEKVKQALREKEYNPKVKDRYLGGNGDATNEYADNTALLPTDLHDESFPIAATSDQRISNEMYNHEEPGLANYRVSHLHRRGSGSESEKGSIGGSRRAAFTEIDFGKTKRPRRSENDDETIDLFRMEPYLSHTQQAHVRSMYFSPYPGHMSLFQGTGDRVDAPTPFFQPGHLTYPPYSYRSTMRDRNQNEEDHLHTAHQQRQDSRALYNLPFQRSVPERPFYGRSYGVHSDLSDIDMMQHYLDVNQGRLHEQHPQVSYAPTSVVSTGFINDQGNPRSNLDDYDEYECHDHSDKK